MKPANILVGSDGQVKLVDFGLAEVLGTNSYAGGAGTYAYMAPEDFDENEHSDAQSDIWAAGVILYEMLTGRRPFHAARPKNPFAWGRAVNKDDIPPPSASRPDIPLELDEVCFRALERDKGQRYKTADTFAQDLRALSLDGLRLGPAPAYAAPPPRVNAVPKVGAPPETLLGAADIDRFLEVAPGRWPEACEALENRTLAVWLRGTGEPLLASVADELAQREDLPVEARLRDFLYRAGLNVEDAARREATRGSEFLRARAYEDAASALRLALRLDPMHPSYYHLLAHAYTSLQNPDSARAVLEDGLELFPNHRALRRDLKAVAGGRAQMSVPSVNFGALRPGEARTTQITVRGTDLSPLQGRVASLPGWLKVTPLKFNARQRQILKLEADTDHLPAEAGEYGEPLVLETSGGRLELPVMVTLLPPRPNFWQVFYWYLPLAALCLLPVLLGYDASLQSHRHGRTLPLYPTGYIASGALFVTFFGINLQADTQRRERFMAGLGMLLAPVGVGMFLLKVMSAPERAKETLPTIIFAGLSCRPLAIAARRRRVALARGLGSLAGVGAGHRDCLRHRLRRALGRGPRAAIA